MQTAKQQNYTLDCVLLHSGLSKILLSVITVFEHTYYEGSISIIPLVDILNSINVYPLIDFRKSISPFMDIHNSLFCISKIIMDFQFYFMISKSMKTDNQKRKY